MPIVWDGTTYTKAYQITIGWADPTDPTNANGERIGEVLTYGKDFARYCQRGTGENPFYRHRAGYIIPVLTQLGVTAADRGLIANCGYGYTIRAMHLAGYASFWGLEPNAYLTETNRWNHNKATLVGVTFDSIVNITGGSLKAKLRQATGDDRFHTVITEHLLENYNATETAGLTQVFNVCAAGLYSDQRRAIHLVSDVLPEEYGLTYDNDPPLRWLTLEAWAALRPQQTFISVNTGRAIIGTG